MKIPIAILHGLRIPEDFYPVLGEPVPLAGMVLPRPPLPDWEGLHGEGYRWIACLCTTRPQYQPAPLQHLAKVELTDLAEGGEPYAMELEEEAIHVLGRMIHRRLLAGEGVIVHCAGGRGRTGTVLGAALRLMGHGTEEIVQYLDQIHQARGKPGWSESAWQREVVGRIKLPSPDFHAPS